MTATCHTGTCRAKYLCRYKKDHDAGKRSLSGSSRSFDPDNDVLKICIRILHSV